MDLGLPIIKYTTPTRGPSIAFNKIDKTSSESILFEIDLMNVKKDIQKKLKVDKIDCYPLLWCQQEKKRVTWAHKFAQKVGCTYMAVKLIDRHKPTSASYSNIDMFPLHFMGHTMSLPPVTSLKEYKKKASEKKK